MAQLKSFVKAIEGLTEDAAKSFLKDSNYEFKTIRGKSHIINEVGEKVKLNDLVKSYNTQNTKKVVEDVISNEKPIINIPRGTTGTEPTLDAAKLEAQRKAKESVNSITPDGDSKLGNMLNYLRQNDTSTVIHNNIMEDQKILRSPIVKTKPIDNVALPKHGPVNTVYAAGRDERIAASKVGPLPVSNSAAEHLDRVSTNSRKTIPVDYSQVKKKSAFQEKFDGALKKAIPVAVGGGLIFSMFNRGGQQSNSELYGQKQSYGGGY